MVAAIIICFVLWTGFMFCLIKHDRHYLDLKDELRFKDAYIEYLKRHIESKAEKKGE